MILVTGAAGKTGQRVIRALVRRNQRVRALIRPNREDQRTLMGALGVTETVTGDMAEPATWEGALTPGQTTGPVRAIYHICPNMHRGEVEIGRLMIKEALNRAASRVVYHSVLLPQTEAMEHHWNKLRVEEMLVESNLNYTILQPAAYMQNILANRSQIRGEGIYRMPYPPETRLNLVDLEDVAEAAAMVLTGRVGTPTNSPADHSFATYQLAGPATMSQHQVAALLGEVFGREVTAQGLALEEWAGEARAGGLDEYRIKTLVSMFKFYGQYGFAGNGNVHQWILGRPLTTLREFILRDMT